MQGNDKNERFLFRRSLFEFTLIFVYCRANFAFHKTHELLLFHALKLHTIRTEFANIYQVSSLHPINAVEPFPFLCYNKKKTQRRLSYDP